MLHEDSYYFLIIVLWSINMEAKVKLPPLLSDNMVYSKKAMYESGEKDSKFFCCSNSFMGK